MESFQETFGVLGVSGGIWSFRGGWVLQGFFFGYRGIGVLGVWILGKVWGPGELGFRGFKEVWDMGGLLGVLSGLGAQKDPRDVLGTFWGPRDVFGVILWSQGCFLG